MKRVEIDESQIGVISSHK